MLFETKIREFESEKERNLYYKFFAGFYFNELINWHPTAHNGYAERLKDFYEQLSVRIFPQGDAKGIALPPPGQNVSVSFDNHIDRHHAGEKGEFADVLIHDHKNHLLIGIEAKYLTNWKYEKDVLANEDKLGIMCNKLGAERRLLCLLLTQRKWANVKAKQASRNSNYRKLVDHKGGKVVVILWEDLIALPSVHPMVKNYMTDQLLRR